MNQADTAWMLISTAPFRPCTTVLVRASIRSLAAPAHQSEHRGAGLTSVYRHPTLSHSNSITLSP